MRSPSRWLLAVVVVALARWGERPLDAVFRVLAHAPRAPAQPSPCIGEHDRRARRPAQAAHRARRVRLDDALVARPRRRFWLVMRAFDLRLSPLAGLLVVIAVGLAMILPSPPAALGVFEGATVVAVQAYDVGDANALSYALLLHALNVLPFIAIAAAGAAVRFGVAYRRRT